MGLKTGMISDHLRTFKKYLKYTFISIGKFFLIWVSLVISVVTTDLNI